MLVQNVGTTVEQPGGVSDAGPKCGWCIRCWLKMWVVYPCWGWFTLSPTATRAGPKCRVYLVPVTYYPLLGVAVPAGKQSQ